jgi:hypothetical protein
MVLVNSYYNSTQKIKMKKKRKEGGRKEEKGG